MGELVSAAFLQLERMIPERYRVRLVACTSLLGLLAWIYVSSHMYARAADVNEFKRQVTQSINTAVKPLEDQMKSDENTSNRHYLEDLSSQILQVAGRCTETKDPNARDFYRSSLVQLLERYFNTAGHPYPQSVTCN